MTAPTDPFDPIAWQAQEHARRSERLQLDADGGTPDRLVARALRSAPMPALPADFARSIAQRAQAQAQVRGGDSRVETMLTVALGIAFGIAGLIVTLLYGATWWQATSALLSDTQPSASGWLMAGAGCMALTWMSSRLRARGDALR